MIRSEFDVREPLSGDPMTADERNNLISEGFDVDETYPEYGQRSLLQAYRAGFHDSPHGSTQPTPEPSEVGRDV